MPVTAKLSKEFYQEGGLLARIGMAEGRLARLTLVLWVGTLGTLIALLKF